MKFNYFSEDSVRSSGGQKEMTRGRAWRRKKNFSKGIRKKKLAEILDRDWYEHDGQYIKGKIHCSCSCCAPKTNDAKCRGKGRNWTYADLKKIYAMNQKREEYKNWFERNIGLINEIYKMAEIEQFAPDDVDSCDETIWKNIRDDTKLPFKLIVTNECEKCKYGTIDENNKAHVMVHCSAKDEDYFYGACIPCECKEIKGGGET